jgi:N-acetylglucosaminyldiphosphoundecaprenol N-acetyl-beta-D-mannosaminyltransferase
MDHFVLAETVDSFRDAYGRAHLCLVDGTPVKWATRLIGHALPEKVSGSDLLLPLLELAGRHHWSVYLLGAGPGVADEVAQMAKERYGVRIAGTDSPRIDHTKPVSPDQPELQRIIQAKPDLLMVALGSPKQESWIGKVDGLISPTVAIGVGAGFDFVTGRVKRAPRWISRAGLEWLYRLVKEPKRLWRRYLVQDPKFAAVLLKTLKAPKAERVKLRGCEVPLLTK